MKKLILLLFTAIFAVTISHAQSPINWSMSMDVATSASGNAHPRVEMDAIGNPLVLWYHNNNAMFSRWNGSAFTMPMMLNPMGMGVAGADWMGPDMAAHGDTVYVVFKRSPEMSDTNHIYCLRSVNGGMTFGAPVRVDYINDSLSRFPTVTTDDMGNPIVAFMKFDPAFGDARWVVVKSTDFGTSFSADVKASGWSDANSTVCDCCPGAIVSSANKVAMLYRDNNSDIRDSWAGISTDGGSSFTSGANIDQQNWNINACPSTGPDGVIIGDTLYSTFMSGASGQSLVYWNSSALTAIPSSATMPITGMVMGMTQQNFPRMATDGTALAIVWKQTVSGSNQCVVRFTNNIANGLPAAYDTVALSGTTNSDVVVKMGNIFVVWQDNNSGTVKYRKGTFNSVTAVEDNISQTSFSVFPNPSTSVINVASAQIIDEIVVTNTLGQTVYQASSTEKNISLHIEKAGIYFVTITSGKEIATRKLIVIP